ncbi:MAG: winged helix-turn-helix transcriptional regulator, partial [Pseudomonadota bacterium]|nr:winged helix-turn-helix transcriptional regulator [Pseudomonadota bacterium]
MKWENINEQVCSVARALSIVGERWTLLIIRDAFKGTRRFEGFHKNLGV